MNRKGKRGKEKRGRRERKRKEASIGTRGAEVTVLGGADLRAVIPLPTDLPSTDKGNIRGRGEKGKKDTRKKEGGKTRERATKGHGPPTMCHQSWVSGFFFFSCEKKMKGEGGEKKKGEEERKKGKEGEWPCGLLQSADPIDVRSPPSSMEKKKKENRKRTKKREKKEEERGRNQSTQHSRGRVWPRGRLRLINQKNVNGRGGRKNRGRKGKE